MSTDIPITSEFDSVDPAPPSEDRNVENLRNTLNDSESTIIYKIHQIIYQIQKMPNIHREPKHMMGQPAGQLWKKSGPRVPLGPRCQFSYATSCM